MQITPRFVASSFSTAVQTAEGNAANVLRHAPDVFQRGIPTFSGDKKEPDSEATKLLMSSAANNDVENMEKARIQGANLHASDSTGWSPLTVAAKAGAMKSIEYLYDNRVDLDTPDANGWSALNRAIGAGKRSAMTRLVKYGANTKLADGNGNTPNYIVGKKDYWPVGKHWDQITPRS